MSGGEVLVWCGNACTRADRAAQTSMRLQRTCLRVAAHLDLDGLQRSTGVRLEQDVHHVLLQLLRVVNQQTGNTAAARQRADTLERLAQRTEVERDWGSAGHSSASSRYSQRATARACV